MFVEVLPCDMKRARALNCFACPVSRAIRRQMQRAKNDDYVLVDGLDVLLGELAIRLPEEAVQWVADFDDGYSVEVPFSFSLDVPADVSLEYVRGRMMALSLNMGARSGEMRSLGQVIDEAQAQVSDMDEWNRAA